MPKRPVEKRFDVCDKDGYILGFAVVLEAFMNGWNLDALRRAKLLSACRSITSKEYYAVRVQ